MAFAAHQRNERDVALFGVVNDEGDRGIGGFEGAVARIEPVLVLKDRGGAAVAPPRGGFERGFLRTTPSTPRAQSPKSARKRMRTCGQRARIWVTIRATSSTLPALASMSEGRSLAASRCRPQNT